jgi:hypothetical protein
LIRFGVGDVHCLAALGAAADESAANPNADRVVKPVTEARAKLVMRRVDEEQRAAPRTQEPARPVHNHLQSNLNLKHSAEHLRDLKNRFQFRFVAIELLVEMRSRMTRP